MQVHLGRLLLLLPLLPTQHAPVVWDTLMMDLMNFAKFVITPGIITKFYIIIFLVLMLQATSIAVVKRII